MFQVELSATKRDVSGKGPMRQLRMKGITPAVVYGEGNEAQMLQLETKSLHSKLLEFYRKNTVVTLNIDGENKNVRFGEVQTDPVRDTLIHVDFCEIDMNKTYTYDVPISYQGKAKGVDLGGNLIVASRSVKLAGKPLDIPNEVEIAISSLAIGDSISFGDIALAENVTLQEDKDQIIISVEKS